MHVYSQLVAEIGSHLPGNNYLLTNAYPGLHFKHAFSSLFAVHVTHVLWQDDSPRAEHEVGGISSFVKALPFAVLQILQEEELLVYEQVKQLK